MVVALVEEGRCTIVTNLAPADVSGWRDWSRKLISERLLEERDDPWAHPNSRFTTTLGSVPTLAHDAEACGRLHGREPLIRTIDDLVVEATRAAEGRDGEVAR